MTDLITSTALRFLLFFGLAASILPSGTGQAIEESSFHRTVRLAVMNMDCPTCPAAVKKSLEAVPGVMNVIVSEKDKTVVIVTYDYSKTTPQALTKATDDAGYPSTMKH